MDMNNNNLVNDIKSLLAPKEELNKKLIEKKAEETNENAKKKENQTILERKKETREKCARIGRAIVTLVIIFTIILAILFG